MDEQIMSWATSRPEVSKEDNNFMVVLNESSGSKCLCVYTLMSPTEACTHLVPSACLNELTNQILICLWFSRTGTWEVNVMSTCGVLAGMDSWQKLEET